MKRYLIILMLLSLAAAAVSAGAVDLQAGWYASFGDVFMEGISGQELYSAYWYPTSSLGQSGSLLVTDPNNRGEDRKIMITGNVSVPGGVLFEDAGTYDGRGLDYLAVGLGWMTNYDATKMRLQLLRRRSGEADVLAWEEDRSGLQAGVSSSVWRLGQIVPGDQIVFRVVAIPEPTGLLSLTCGLVGLLWRSRRRR